MLDQHRLKGAEKIGLVLEPVGNTGLADPAMRSRLDDLGIVVLAGSPADFAQLIAEETAEWAKVVRFTGAKAD
jgi:hypothetical protein